jgi:hypothetical protein
VLTQGQALPLEGDDPAQPGLALYQELVTGHEWLNKLAQVCQCCTQGKDAARPEDKRRSCAIGQCCHAALSARSRADARDTLRAALTCAVEEEIITRNPVAVVRLPAPRTRKRRWWTVDEG